MPFVSPESVNLIHGQWLEVRVLYNVSLITSINPTKEFIPSFFRLCIGGVALTGLYSGVSPRRKLVRYFPRTCTKYLCRYANFIPLPQPARPYPLSRSPSQITPSLSPSLQNALQINVEVPTRVVLSVVQHEQYNDKRKKKKKQKERERVEKTMEKAKIVLPMLYNGVKSNGV